MPDPERLCLLFIAPLPPPITGMSVASQSLLDGLPRAWETRVVNLSKAELASGNATLARALEVLTLAKRVWRLSKGADRIYITISQSTIGNLKDLLLLAVIGAAGQRNTIAHLHGGPGMRDVMNGRLGWLNRRILGRLRALVVLGNRHRDIFAGLDSPVVVVPNYADPALFQPEDAIAIKHAAGTPLRVLALANFIHGKGQTELLDAWISLPAHYRERIELSFAGAFETEADKQSFLERLKPYPSLKYYGVVEGEAKRELLWSSHMLSIPSYHRYGEGQPISILEAYAAGLAVVTTDHGGIFDVFTPGVNGFAVSKASPEDIAAALRMAVDDRGTLARVGQMNRAEAAASYRLETYRSSLIDLIAGNS
jgi:glycosyltransferase involved in cell wall biosynthesis